MISFKQFLAEENEYENHGETKRTKVRSYGHPKQRLFYDAHLKDEHKNWLTKGREVPTASATIDINHEHKTAYINRLDAHRKGEGFGHELSKHIENDLKHTHGIKHISGYIEHGNHAAQNNAKKQGRIETKRGEHGSYWTKEL